MVDDGELEANPELLDLGRDHLDAVRGLSPGIHNGAVLGLLAVRDGRLHVRRGGYFTMIATSDALKAEYEWAAERGAIAAGLPMRSIAHRAAGVDPLRTGTGRHAAIGVSVVTSIPVSPGRRGIVLGRRRPDLATDPGRWHVVPSGMVDATDGSVVETARRELAEELRIEISEPELAERLAVLGVGYDLLRLKPDVCLRLDLADGEFPADGPAADPGEFDGQAVIALEHNCLRAFWCAHPPGLLTPAAASAIALLEDDLALA